MGLSAAELNAAELSVASQRTDGESAELKALVVDHLVDARARTRELLAPISPADLERQVSPLMSPLAWDLAHIGHYEELWLLRALTGAAPTDPRFDDLYDAFQHPRRERSSLPILDARGAEAFAADVRSRVLDTLTNISLDPEDPLTTDAFVYGMVIQHEHQHRETMLATLNLLGATPHPESGGTEPDQDSEQPSGRDPGIPGRSERDQNDVDREIAMPGGTFVMGVDHEPWALDNERPAHEVELGPFHMDTTPVTNRQYVTFIADGGYDDARLWTDAGWEWRQQAGLEHPEFWAPEGAGAWSRLRFGQHADLALDEPVQHVCWYEADAFARWTGKRLPSEAEWEYAASSRPDGTKTRYPWGNADPTPALANLGQLRIDPTAVGTLPSGANLWGCKQLIGDVWEWTSSDFHGYPGFRAHPYREYSEVFFGSEYKVLRGGSWATHPSACRATFRNWDYPIRRQIFCGFRCARNA